MNNIEIRRTLLRRQHELSRRLDELEADLTQAHDQDWSEQAVERENDEVLEAIATQTAQELVQIDHVLQMLTDNHYGICRECGQPIGVERLKALPSAETCISCANASLRAVN